MSDEPFLSESSFDPEHPRALAMYCSDGRFTRAVEELVRHLGFERLDTLTIPGGAALLDAASASHSDVEHIRRATSFLVQGHHITHVVLAAHEGCGYYKTRYPRKRADEIRTLQLDDLRTAARWLKTAHLGDIAVDLYFARSLSKRVEFQPIA